MIGLREFRDRDQITTEGRFFPHMIDARGSSIENNKTVWDKEMKHWLLNKLDTEGAIVLRNLDITGADDLDGFTRSFGFDPYPMNSYTLAARRHVGGNIYTANDVKVEVELPIHHEMTQAPVPPVVLFFFCKQPAMSGGRNPLAFSPAVYDKMAEREPEFVRKLKQHGVRYVNLARRHTDSNSSVGTGWHTLFNTVDREKAAETATDMGYTVAWKTGDVLEMVSPTINAFTTHPVTGRTAWFNKIITWYKLHMRNDPAGVHTLYGDFSEMPLSALNTMDEVIEEETVKIQWHKGDLVLLDNRLVMHGKSGGKGPREMWCSFFT